MAPRCVELVCEAPEVALEPQLPPPRPSCLQCELGRELSDLEDLMREMEIIDVGELRAYDQLKRAILGAAKQRSRLQLIETVKLTRLLTEFRVKLDPIPGRPSAARYAGCADHRSISSSQYPNLSGKGPERSATAGSKRAIKHCVNSVDSVDELCRSPASEGPSKKFKQFGFQLHSALTDEPDETVVCGSNLDHQNSSGAKRKTSTDDSSAAYMSPCIRDELILPRPTLDSVPAKEFCRSFRSAISIPLFGAVSDLRVVRWLSKKRRTESPRPRVELLRKTAATGWEALPDDVQANVLQRVEIRDLVRFKILSKSCKKFIETDDFRRTRGEISEGTFTAISYYIKDTAWHCRGFNLLSEKWMSLPTFSCLPAPDADLFKEYSVCGHGGLMCADVSKFPNKGELVVFNPLTGKKRPLPPLLHPRNPVLVHLSVNSAQSSFTVIVAGSSTASDEHLSKKMEVFDSTTSKWTETPDLPGPAFGLNEHQTGVCVNGILFFISFLEGDSGRGVLAFDVENRTWLKHMACPIPFSSYSNTLQLVESDGKVYLFSEQEQRGCVEHCIHELVLPKSKTACRWSDVVREKKSGGRGLLVYPEHTCIVFGKGKLCVFNTLARDGVVYDLQNGKPVDVLKPPPGDHPGETFFTFNPATFTLQPNFASDPNSNFSGKQNVTVARENEEDNCRILSKLVQNS